MTKKRLVIAAAVLCLAVCLGISLFSCQNETDIQQPTETTIAAEPADYTVEVYTDGDMPLENVGIYIYEDDTLEELVWFAKTDAEGKISFTDKARDTYVAVLKNVPDGYLTEEMYPLTGETTRIVLTAGLPSADDLTGVTFELGDIMYDLKVTTPDGTEYVMSELLEQKKAVILNFWYLECQPCRSEFPYLQEAYEKYSKDIEVLALNPVNTDEEAVAAFQKELGLTFPVALCDPIWQEAMQLTAFPTTVVVDRYGTISLIHKGSVTDAETFEAVFEYFTADDYVQGEVKDLDDILAAVDVNTVGTKDNPEELGGVTSFRVTVPAGEEYYINLYKVSKLIMTVKDKDAYVIYNGKTYKPSGSTITLTITSDDVRTPVLLGIGNSGEETKTFTVSFSQPKGSLNNPYTMTLGEFTVNVAAGNDQGVYYTYQCTQDGYITVECLSATAGVPYDFTLYNLSTSAFRNLQSDSQKNADGNYEVTIKVNAGNTLQFSACSLPDSSGNYPAATLKFLASYSETADIEETEDNTITYSVTMTDENRTPVANMQVYLTVDGEEVILTTNANGIAAKKLEPGTYEAKLRLIGYEAKTTAFTLTEDIPTIAVKLDKSEAGAGESEVLPNVGIAYLVYDGDNFVVTDPEFYNYFIFEPTQSGLYQISTTDPAAQLSDWGATTYPNKMGEDFAGNTYTINVKESSVGNVGYVIGIRGTESATLTITRIGDYIKDETDEPWSTDWMNGLTAPPTTQFSMRENGAKLVYVDLTTEAQAVLGSDGYYHLNSADGPILYVNLGPNAPYVSLYDMLGFNGDGGGAQNLTRYFYEYQEDGTEIFIKKELYTEWMRQYIQMRDAAYDVYPLTDALIYMIQNGGEHIGWWNPGESVYKFGDIDLAEGMGWMFACCYVP